MPTNDIFMPIIIIAIILFAIARQVLPRRVRRMTFIILPVLALYEAYKNLPHDFIPMNQLIECLLTVIVAACMGAVQARFTKVYYKEGQLYTQGGWQTLAVWFTLLVARIMIELSFNGREAFTSFSQFQWIMWFGVASVFGIRNTLLYFMHPEIRHTLTQDKRRRNR